MKLGAAVLVAGLGCARAATAEPIDLGPASLALDDSWTGDAPPAAPVTSIARRSGDAQLVAVRYDIPNLEAWRSGTQPALVAAIVAGFAAAPGYQPLGKPVVRRLGPGSTPTLDLTFRRRGAAGAEVVAVRVLLFRTTTIAAVASSPTDRAVVERAIATLTPD